MSATQKKTSAEPQYTPDAEEPETGAALEDVSEATDVEASESPARTMQDRLHRSLSDQPRSGSVMDIGRVLAAASGITLILGVFIFNGIW